MSSVDIGSDISSPLQGQGSIIRLQIREGLRLVADIAGPRGAPLVVLLHGGAQSRRAWGRGADLLVNAGFRALSIDMRGHGESDWAPDGQYGLEHWAEDLIIIVRRLAQEEGPVALVGASRGGQSALLASVAQPDAVWAVVLIDVTPQTDDSGIAMIRDFMERSALGFKTVGEASAHLSEFTGRSRGGNLASLARLMRQADDGRWYWHWDPRMAQPQFVRPPSEVAQMHEAAQRVETPLLLIRAGNSELVRPTDVEHFKKLTPHLESVEIPGIGHMLTGDSNEAFMPAVIRFLYRVRDT